MSTVNDNSKQKTWRSSTAARGVNQRMPLEQEQIGLPKKMSREMIPRHRQVSPSFVGTMEVVLTDAEYFLPSYQKPALAKGNVGKATLRAAGMYGSP